MTKASITSLLVLVAVSSLGRWADKAPNFKLRDLHNKEVELKDLLKEGPVLLDFWATWCKPCLKSFPILESWHQKYGEKGLVVVGINEDGPRNQAKIKPFVRSLKVSFKVLVDGNNEIMRRLQVQNLPTSLLIAPDRTIIARHVGYTPESMKELEDEILAYLEDHPPDGKE